MSVPTWIWQRPQRLLARLLVLSLRLQAANLQTISAGQIAAAAAIAQERRYLDLTFRSPPMRKRP